jgi:hypothetical protein
MIKSTILIINCLLINSIFAQEVENPKKKLTPEQQRIKIKQEKMILRQNMRDSVKYFKAKYEPAARDSLRDLNKDKARYERGLAKLNKNSKTYKTRKAEYDVILNKIKAQKIILIFSKIYIGYLDAYDEGNVENFIKLQSTYMELQRSYKELSGEPFPNFVGEYIQTKEGRKKRKRSSQKFE